MLLECMFNFYRMNVMLLGCMLNFYRMNVMLLECMLNFYRMNVMLLECMLSLAFNTLMLSACWPLLFLRTGNVVVLSLGKDVEPAPALLLTLWPSTKKSRPCVQHVAISRVKCFRAVLLAESKDANDRRLLPTDFVWRYFPNQVIAILDVEETCLPEGKIVISEKSVEALQWLKSQRFDVHVEEQANGKRKKGKTTKGASTVKKDKPSKSSKKTKTGAEKEKTGKTKRTAFKVIRERIRKANVATKKRKACALDAAEDPGSWVKRGVTIKGDKRGTS